MLVGTDGPDVIYAGGGDDVILGLGGDDILCGAGGGDRIAGGDGRDWIDGADDPMALRAEAGKKTDDRADVISGGPGNDNAGGLDGDDFIDGGDGDDEIGGQRGRDIVIGGSGNDATYGGSYPAEYDRADILIGDEGDDHLTFAGAGDDLLLAGAGDDRLQGELGNDELRGGDGNDKLGLPWVEVENGNDRLFGGNGDDQLDGGPGFDRTDGEDGNDACVNGETVFSCELGALPALGLYARWGGSRPSGCQAGGRTPARARPRERSASSLPAAAIARECSGGPGAACGGGGAASAGCAGTGSGTPESSASWVSIESASSAEVTSSGFWRRKPSIGSRAAIAASVTGSAALLVGADRDQVGLVAVGGHQAPDVVARRAHVARDDLADEARDAGQHVDRRVVAGVREVAREHDVAVEDRAHRVGDRLVHVVAVDQHGVEAGDRAARRGAGALEQLRQQGEHARRVAARGGRLADRQADLALGHGEARDRVHHQHDVAALVAEVLGDRGGGEGGLDAHQRGLVGGGHDDHGAGHALGAEVALDELAHLAASLADQADDVDVGRRRAGDHAQQRRLADAGAGEDAEPLAAAAGDEGVERAHAERDALVDARARQRIRRRAPRPAR